MLFRSEDRAALLMELANLPEHPQSVTINNLVRVPGTPLEDTAAIDPLEFVRTIAVARIVMPGSVVRLSAGRADMSDDLWLGEGFTNYFDGLVQFVHDVDAGRF